VLTVEQIKDDELFRLRKDLREVVAARAADRREWIGHMRTLGLMLKQAKEEGFLDALIEANLWPLPKCAITDEDVRKSVEIARRIRPLIEAEQKP
jgi:hypothetical protein